MGELMKIVNLFEKKKEELFQDDSFDINLAEVLQEQYGDELPEKLKNATPGSPEQKLMKKAYQKKNPHALLEDVFKELYGENLPQSMKEYQNKTATADGEKGKKGKKGKKETSKDGKKAKGTKAEEKAQKKEKKKKEAEA